MNESISIPVFFDLEDADNKKFVGEPAAIVDTIVRKASKKIKGLLIDENDILSCIDSIANIYSSIQEKTSKDHPELKLDSLDFQLGFSSTGGIAVMGPSFNANVLAVVKITIKSR